MLNHLHPNLCDTISKVCFDNGVEVKDILSRRRNREIVKARWIAFKLVEVYTDHSYHHIARIFHKDHKTVLNAFKNMARHHPDIARYVAWYEERN